ncbi:MAG: type I secretion system permease/ATPase [Prosthecochloris sp.]|nr:type I secretion system permease/ATPase [Prosthecochloris sp.]
MKMRSLLESRLGSLLLTFKKEFLWVGGFSFIANLLMLTPTLYMLQVYDRVLVSRNELTLLFLTLLMVGLFGFMAFAEWLRSRLLVRIGVRIDELLNSRVFTASFKAFLKHARQQTVQVFGDLASIRQFLTGNGIIAFFDMPWTPVYIMVMFMLHPWIGVLGVVFALLQAANAWKSHVNTSPAIEKASDAVMHATAFVQTKLSNSEPVHAMGMTLPLRKRWLERHSEALDASSDLHRRQQSQQSAAKFIRLSMQSLTLAAGALLVLSGEVTVGAMIAGNVLMSRALAPLDLMVTTWKQFVQARQSFFRLENLLSDDDPVTTSRSSGDIRGEIRVEELSATAQQGSVPILHGISTTFRPGELVAIIGPSGSGKSTFARCLTGIWPETKGRVLIDGIDVRQWDRSVLGPRLGYLPQDVELFDGSFAENIARFSEIDPDRVIKASTMTGIHEMLLRFPEGYDTQIGAGGRMLSGGQRQRVALARALYGDPPVLVLDEPNAHLDETGEKALNEALRRMASEGKTVILITHRPAVLNLVDRIVVMHEGHITDDGPRNDVLRKMATKQKSSVQALS